MVWLHLLKRLAWVWQQRVKYGSTSWVQKYTISRNFFAYASPKIRLRYAYTTVTLHRSYVEGTSKLQRAYNLVLTTDWAADARFDFLYRKRERLERAASQRGGLQDQHSFAALSPMQQRTTHSISAHYRNQPDDTRLSL